MEISGKHDVFENHVQMCEKERKETRKVRLVVGVLCCSQKCLHPPSSDLLSTKDEKHSPKRKYSSLADEEIFLYGWLGFFGKGEGAGVGRCTGWATSSHPLMLSPFLSCVPLVSKAVFCGLEGRGMGGFVVWNGCARLGSRPSSG